MSSTGERATSVAVCALTYRRPHTLARLLDAMATLRVPAGVAVRMVVVDNDPDASGSAVVDAAVAGGRVPFPVRYVVEARRGIAAARNRAVAEAAGCRFVAFIDDDEVPDDGWLAELLRVRTETGADVVTGPVLSAFEEPPPAWVTRGGFFDRPRHATGEAIDYARTGNVLIDTALLARWEPPFDEAFSLSGGEDTHFFMRAHLAGHRIVWADEAVVTEAVPGTRITARWLLQRQYRRGNTVSLCVLELRRGRFEAARQAAKAGQRMLRGLGRLVRNIRSGRAGVVRGLGDVWLGAGLLSGVVGRRYHEYQRVHSVKR